MRSYIVLYRIEAIMFPIDTPFSFHCMAENVDHAEEQLLNSDPDANIVWVSATHDKDKALLDWMTVLPPTLLKHLKSIYID